MTSTRSFGGNVSSVDGGLDWSSPLKLLVYSPTIMSTETFNDSKKGNPTSSDAISPVRAKVTFLNKGTFNFTECDPPALIMPFQSKDIPAEYHNWSLVAEKEGPLIIDDQGKHCICKVSFLNKEADPYLQSSLKGHYVAGTTLIARIEIL